MKNYNDFLKAVLCKAAEVDENIDDKEVEKIDQIYFNLTNNHFHKMNIYIQILEKDKNKKIDDFILENKKYFSTKEKQNIVSAVQNVIDADGINHKTETEFLDKIKFLIN